MKTSHTQNNQQHLQFPNYVAAYPLKKILGYSSKMLIQTNTDVAHYRTVFNHAFT